MALVDGLERAADGSLSITAAGTIILQYGVPITSAREVRTNTITGAPSSQVLSHGVSFHTDGSLNVTADAIGKIVGGVAFTNLGVLCITTNAPDNNSRRAYLAGIGTVLVDSTGRVHVS